MIEVRSESTFDFSRDRLVMINGGIIHGVGHAILYARIGHSLLSDDGAGHTYLGFGLKLLITPSSRP
jgi:hypothetical protein